MSLESAGWNGYWAQQLAHCGEFLSGRVIAQQRGLYQLWTQVGEIHAELAGALRHRSRPGELPVIGDWVAFLQCAAGDRGTIHKVLPRKTSFSRKVSGAAVAEQVIAANIDLLIIVCGLDGDYNLRRFERYIVAARQSGADTLIVLNKSDLCANLGDRTAEVRAIALGIPVIVISAKSGRGIDSLEQFIAPGQTSALVGSSGAGKSTIMNRLLAEEVQRTRPTRETGGRGRHTTTHRELFFLKNGGMVLDNPGIRELQLWGGQMSGRGDAGPETVDEAFPDIDALALRCAFRDCSHEVEPDCAVRASLALGELDQGRWRNYLKLRRELRHAAVQVNENLRRVEKEKIKKACYRIKRHQK